MMVVDEGNVFIMGATALMQGSEAGQLKVCEYSPGAGGGSGTVSSCHTLWDHKQAPKPAASGSPPAS